MKPAATPQPPVQRSHPVLLSATFFLVGAGVTGLLLRHPHGGVSQAGLAAPVQSMLGHLSAPVTLRYYSLLPTAGADPALLAFAGRVEQMLEDMQATSDGKIQITRIENQGEKNANAATAEGIQPFNLDKGSAYFLGLTVTSQDHKETFARLEPEWEPALQYDLARAIQRVTVVPPPPPPPPEVAKPSPEIISSVQRLIPDVSAVSVADADRLFLDDYLSQSTAASQEFKAKLSEAAKQVDQVRDQGSAADIEAARSHLLKVELDQGDKLKALGARLNIQMAVFRQMKATNAAASPAP
jgi:hypothetical protein